MEHTLTLTLRARKTGPPSGSALPDTGHDAYSLMKELPNILIMGIDGKMRTVGEKYDVVNVATGVTPMNGGA